MKRTSVKYEILSKLPIKVVVDANATSATICWDYKATISYDNSKCEAEETISTQCHDLEIDANDSCEEKIIEGELKWQREKISIPYRIVQMANPLEHCECNPQFEGEKYELLDYWLEPSNVIECGGESPKLHYKYNKLAVNTATCEIESEELSNNITIECNCYSEDGHIERHTGSTEIEFLDGSKHEAIYGYICNACAEECQEETKIMVGNISYDVVSYTLNDDKRENIKHTPYVTCKGYKKEDNKVINEVHYTVEYAIVSIDESCVKTKTNRVYKGVWDREEEDTHFYGPPECISADCCSDHYVTTSVTINLDETLYDIELSILMKGDSEKVCYGDCESLPTIGDTTYCVDKDSAVVYYPQTDEFGVKQWLSGGTVSKYGGEVKVKFHYSGYTSGTDGATEGDYYEIINVPPCLCPLGLSSSIASSNTCNLDGEIEFKTAHEDGCNVLKYKVIQEVCDND